VVMRCSHSLRRHTLFVVTGGRVGVGVGFHTLLLCQVVLPCIYVNMKMVIPVGLPSKDRIRGHTILVLFEEFYTIVRVDVGISFFWRFGYT